MREILNGCYMGEKGLKKKKVEYKSIKETVGNVCIVEGFEGYVA